MIRIIRKQFIEEHFRSVMLLVLLSLVVHLVVLTVCYLSSSENAGQMLKRADGHSYLQVADLIIEGKSLSDPFVGRVFPGWPIAFAPAYAWLKSLWVPIALAMLISCLLPVAQKSVSKGNAAAIVMICGTPTLLMHSVLAMSEPLFLLLTLGACMFFGSGRLYLSAVLTGFASWVRPTSFFLWLGQVLELLASGRRVDAVKMSLLAGGAAGSMFLFNTWLYESPFFQFGQYGTLPNISEETRQSLGLAVDSGSHFGLPLVNLIKTSVLTNPPAWKQIFIWSHVLLLFGILVGGTARSSRKQPYWLCNFVWAAGTGVFILCTGPYWAFNSFDRYFVWALPAYLNLMQPWLERYRWLPWGVFCVSVTLGVAGVIKS